MKKVGYKHTEEAKRKIGLASKKRKRKPFTEEQRKKRSKLFRELKFGKWNIGKKHSKETKQKMSVSNVKFFKGKKFSKEHIENLRISHKGNKPTLETRKKMSKAQIGALHHNWKGGVSSENDKLRHNFEMTLWRKTVLERDNFTCQKYGTRGGKLNVHHINNFSEFPELRTSIENGITLSEKAHKEFHKIYSNKNNTKEQLEEFLII